MSSYDPLSLEYIISRKCVHFNGVMERVCEAGVNYSDVRVEEGDGPYKFPCLRQGGECSKVHFRTDEEVKEKADEIRNGGIKVMIAMASIKEHVAKTSERGGFIPCQCGGQLHFAVAGSNGHVWGKCNTCGMSFNE